MKNKPSVVMMGLGYIGLPTAALIASRGLKVTGVDIRQGVVDTINKGEIHIVEPDLDGLVHKVVKEKFLKASIAGLALLTLPRISFAQSNPDVIVIGAGSAGLSATAELMKKGKSVVCIEAMNRIGGRCYTDNSIFGVPYDMGAPIS